MSNIQNYMRQHKEIREVSGTIMKFVKDNEVENNTRTIAKNINQLAGKLKIHLTTEDKYLYPSLKKSTDVSLKSLGEKFEKEMGGIAVNFTEYKDKYNISTKIDTNIATFKKDTKDIIAALEKRMNNEENNLYKKL